jgi:hypothetical protein
MSMDETSVEPLPADLEEVVEAGRTCTHPSQAARARILARLETTLVGPTGGGDGGATGGGPAGAGAGAAAAGATGAKVIGALSAGRLLLGVAIFASGVGVGATVVTLGSPRATVMPAAPKVVAPAPPAPVAVGAPITAPAPPAAPAASAPAASASVPTRPLPRTDDRQLELERALLEMARSALARGDSAAALAALSRHEREFARPRLVEEREALAVQALVRADKTDDARARGTRFRKRFPHSVFAPVVDHALRAAEIDPALPDQ